MVQEQQFLGYFPSGICSGICSVIQADKFSSLDTTGSSDSYLSKVLKVLQSG